MTMEEFIHSVRNKKPPAPEDSVVEFEARIGGRLPDDYRDFLVRCNGGSLGGSLLFTGPTPTGDKASVDIHHIGGCRTESYFSLPRHFDSYPELIPENMVWVMGDSCGNAICLGVREPVRGKIFFWDHEGSGLALLANSFREFIELVHEPVDE